MPRGYVLWRGASQINGEPIVAIATLKTDNRKTGNMIQTWILREDMLPTQAVKQGKDDAICGACPLRGVKGKGRSCYVNLGTGGPNQVFRAYANGQYPELTADATKEVISGRLVRVGSYGDPAAVPIHVWYAILKHAKGWTGYTHQWREPRFSMFKSICMASVSSETEKKLAHMRGWRTFRVRLSEQSIMPNEIVCPASPEGGNKRTCETCLACWGGSPKKPSIVIIGHGSVSIMSALRGHMQQ